MSFLNTAVATAYDCRAVWHPVRHARKSRNAQKVRGFRASGTYGHCIKDHVLIEQEAESVAFCVCSYFGLDDAGDVGKDYSFPYIAGWAQSADITELKSSMDLIRKTAGSIIDGIESEMAKHLEEQQESKNVPTAEKTSVLEELKRAKEKQMEKKLQMKDTLIADRPRSKGKEMVF